jgi:CRP-like cAMP-binding protein
VAPPATPARPVSDLRAAASRFDELDLDVDAAWTSAPPTSTSAAFNSTVASGGTLLHAVESAAREVEPALEVEEEILFDDPPPADSLPRIPLFSDLPPDAFVALFERCPFLRRTVGEVIFEQGSQGEAFYVVCSGSVAIVRTEDGKQKQLAKLGEGSFFGEMALLSGAPRTATVVSRDEDTQLLEISATLLAELSREHPPVAQALRKFCRVRMLANLMNLSPLFKPFNKDDRQALISRFRSRESVPGDTLVREGGTVDGLYVVLAGEVEVTKGGQTLAKLKEGELFGEMSLLTKSQATATVQATRPTSLLRLPRADFDTLISSHPQILVLISELTDDRRRQTEAVLSGTVVMGDEGVMLV